MAKIGAEAHRRIRAAIERGAEIPAGPLDELLRLAIDPDPEAARAGMTALFPGLIEWLNDSFAASAAGYYTELFARIIEFCRKTPEGRPLDEELDAFGLGGREALIARAARIRAESAQPIAVGRLRRIILPSRVTIGADVAITSVLIDGLRRALPPDSAVEIVLLGSSKLGQLYGGDPRIRVREIIYDRGGSLTNRLLSWLAVLAATREEIAGLAHGEFLIIDPDSRLTQLGLLPLLQPAEEPSGYRFFPSREFTVPGLHSLGELAAAWTAGLTGTAATARSFLALPAEFRRPGDDIVRRLRETGAAGVTTVSLGVGGNEEKRVGEEFEIELLRQQSADGWVIVDQGFTTAEREQVARAVAPLAAAGLPVISAGEEAWGLPELPDSGRGILTWHGGIGSLAGLIAASDRYVGYDSSGQHLAAALDVPSRTIFVSDNPPLFAERWAPFGRQCEVVRAEGEGVRRKA